MCITKSFKVKNSLLQGRKSRFVYLLYNDHTLLYIGSSRNVDQRIKWHLSNNKIPFNRHKIIYEGDKWEGYKVERILIKRFKPPYNKQCLKIDKRWNFIA